MSRHCLTTLIRVCLLPLVLGLSLRAPCADSYAQLPQTVSAGGGALASASYSQFASSIGDLATTAAASTSYNARHAYVGQLPEPATIQFGVSSVTIARSDAVVTLPVLRSNDEDDPGAVPYSVSGTSPIAGDGFAPATGSVVFPQAGVVSQPLALSLLTQTDPGITTRFLVTLGTPGDGAVLGPQSTATITVVTVPRPDGKTQPLIVTQSTVVALGGDSWAYDIGVDVSGLQLPHALTDDFALAFTLLSAPPGMILVQTNATTARLIWTQAAGTNDHHAVQIQVTDLMTGLSDWQDLLIYVVQAPQAGG